MRIACSYCGERGHEEFAYRGDATVRRPVAGELASTDGATSAAWHDYIYLRDNPSGAHQELWQHIAGCRAWLVVTRDTRTHEIFRVEPARTVALARDDLR
ncbi:MAG: sarcosine oxidase subunit delta [Hyphomicrobiaceae bacterium]|nr:sarcosine oxidase subunit delta [Hyphomicrobiaceae bacterium]